MPAVPAVTGVEEGLQSIARGVEQHLGRRRPHLDLHLFPEDLT